jgi:hypothetical protein
MLHGPGATLNAEWREKRYNADVFILHKGLCLSRTSDCQSKGLMWPGLFAFPTSLYSSDMHQMLSVILSLSRATLTPLRSLYISSIQVVRTPSSHRSETCSYEGHGRGPRQFPEYCLSVPLVPSGICEPTAHSHGHSMDH